MSGNEVNVPRLLDLLRVLDIRTRSVSGKLSIPEVQAAAYSEKGLMELLDEALAELNNPDLPPLPLDAKREIRRALDALTKLRILPSSQAYAKRYFCEKAFFRAREDPEKRFIYKALDSLFRHRGYLGGLDDPLLEHVKREVEQAFAGFYAIRPAPGWATPARDGAETTRDAALRLTRLLFRVFFAEGLAVELLEAFMGYEEVLYRMSKRYRDHFVHLVYDFLMGCRLLDAFLDEMNATRAVFSGASLPEDEARVRAMRIWLLTAFLHDLGYAAESLRHIRNELQDSFFSRVPGITLSDLTLRLAPYVEQEVSEFLDILAHVLMRTDFSMDLPSLAKTRAALRGRTGSATQSAISALFRDQLDEFDHGVTSALFLMLTLKVDSHEITWPIDRTLQPEEQMKRRGDWEAESQRERAAVGEDIATACTAMAIHNLRQHVYTGLSVSFQDHPFAFLLMLVDDLQEWDRQPDFDRTSQALQAVYGFNVFKRCSSTNELFGEREPTGDPSEETSLFAYLWGRLRAYNGVPITSLRAELLRILGELRREAANAPRETPRGMRARLERHLVRCGASPAASALYRTAFLGLTADVVTLTYIGGEPGRRWDPKDNRLATLHGALARLFTKNLTDGPAICILHGYEDEGATLFFVAEYDADLRTYCPVAGYPSYGGREG